MIIVTVSFNYPQEYNLADYEMLARVFRHSCSKYCPDAKFLDIKVDPPILPDGDRHALNFLYNTIKLEEWLRIIEGSNENIILADADMVAVRPFTESEIFDQEFDVGYTERTEVRLRKDKNTRQYWGEEKIRRMPMNGGIMFVKQTEAARDFFRQYKEVNQRLYDNGYEHQKWRVKYAGMNQAAFGCLFETGKYEAVVKSFPCRIWNAVDTDWPHVIRCGSVFVHMKSRLRRLILGQKMPFGNYKEAMKLWYKEAAEIGEPVWEEN